MAGTSVAAKKGGLRRKLLLATTAAAALVAATVWLLPADETTIAPRDARPSPAGRPFVITEDVPRAGDASGSLTALPETLNPAGASPDLTERILRRQGAGRLFANAQDVALARSKDTLMEPSRRDEAIGHLPFLTERQRSDSREFVRYDARTLESRVEGDQFDILLPAIGATVKAVVDQVESIDGMLRWSGRILDTQEGGQFSITHAPQDGYAVGTFATPLGNFSMESSGGWGWVASQNSDFFLPPGGNDTLHATHPDTPPR